VGNRPSNGATAGMHAEIAGIACCSYAGAHAGKVAISL
jgi:hypothetical protein